MSTVYACLILFALPGNGQVCLKVEYACVPTLYTREAVPLRIAEIPLRRGWELSLNSARRVILVRPGGC